MESKSSTDSPQDAEHGPHNESRAEGPEITGLINRSFIKVFKNHPTRNHRFITGWSRFLKITPPLHPSDVLSCFSEAWAHTPVYILWWWRSVCQVWFLQGSTSIVVLPRLICSGFGLVFVNIVSDGPAQTPSMAQELWRRTGKTR